MAVPAAADRVVVLPGGHSIDVRCPGCAAEQRLAAEPTAALIDGIEAFVRQHSPCE
jgi:hypothetical protein